MNGYIGTKAQAVRLDTYTKKQVDALTKVATTAEAQALTVDTVLLTPKKLGDAILPTMDGSATFTRSSNQIQLTGIVPTLALEVGDVIQITGSASNNRLHTVESITNNNTIIVNYEHRNGAGSLSLVDETATVTIKRIAKWFAAPVGLGQAWVDVFGVRAGNVTYTSTTGRSIQIFIYSNTQSATTELFVDQVAVCYSGSNAAYGHTFQGQAIVPGGSTYKITGNAPTRWRELR